MSPRSPSMMSPRSPSMMSPISAVPVSPRTDGPMPPVSPESPTTPAASDSTDESSIDRSFSKLEQLIQSPGFQALPQRMMSLLARNPDQVLHTRDINLNELYRPVTLATRQIMQLLPGNVLTDAVVSWYAAMVQEGAMKDPSWRQSVIFPPEVFSAWRAKKDIMETMSAVGTKNPFIPDTLILFIVCESAQNWSLIVGRPQNSSSGLVVHLLFFDPNAQFHEHVIDDCVSLVRTCYVSRGGDASTLNIVLRNVQLAADCSCPAPNDCAVSVIALIRSLVAREKLGLPLRLIPAFRFHAIREMLNNSLLPLK